MRTPPTPPPGPAPSSTHSGTAGLVALPGEIVRLPQELAARLLNGLRTVFVSGTVTGQGADGTLNIRSQFGEIAVRSGTPVPADRQVSLQIPPLSGKAATLTPPQLSRNPIPASLLLSKPPGNQATAGNAAPSTSGSPAAPRATPISGPAGPAVPPAASATSAPLAGPSSASPAPATVAAPGLQPGTTAQPPQAAAGRAASADAAAPNPAGRPVPGPQAGSPPTQSPATTPPALAPGATSARAAPPLGRLALTTQLLTQSGGQPSTPPPVVTSQPGGVPQSATPPPQGATPQLSTAPAAGTAPSSLPGSAPAAHAGAPIAAGGVRAPPTVPMPAGNIVDDAIPIDSIRRVPVLREAVSVLNAADPALATQFIRSVLPQSNSQLAATLLFFLSATRSGDIRGWMGGRVTATLDGAGRADLLPKLSAELATPGRATPEATTGDWRTQTIPLYQDGDIGGLAVHIRRTGDEGGDAADGDAAGHRFLIDMDLSRMGRLQLDGLVHDSRFDLTIRSPAAFPEPMRQDLRTLFRDASNAVGLHGGLTFQAGGHDWARVATARGG